MEIMKANWENVYTKKFNGTWYPRESVVKFSARYLKRRVGIEVYDAKKHIKKILDVGCGNGRHVMFFAEQGYDVHGFDISSEAIEVANAWLVQKQLKANMSVGNVDNMFFEDESFDVVISDGVLDHIHFSDAKKVMENIRRICVKGGYVHITLRSTDDSEFGRGDKVDDNTFLLQEGYEKGIIQRYFDLDDIKELFKEFNVFDVEHHIDEYPDVYTLDKSFLQSSKGTKKYIDLSNATSINLRNARWSITAEKK